MYSAERLVGLPIPATSAVDGTGDVVEFTVPAGVSGRLWGVGLIVTTDVEATAPVLGAEVNADEKGTVSLGTPEVGDGIWLAFAEASGKSLSFKAGDTITLTVKTAADTSGAVSGVLLLAVDQRQ